MDVAKDPAVYASVPWKHLYILLCLHVRARCPNTAANELNAVITYNMTITWPRPDLFFSRLVEFLATSMRVDEMFSLSVCRRRASGEQTTRWETTTRANQQLYRWTQVVACQPTSGKPHYCFTYFHCKAYLDNCDYIAGVISLIVCISYGTAVTLRLSGCFSNFSFPKMYLHTKNELSSSRLSKVTALQRDIHTDRQTDRHTHRQMRRKTLPSRRRGWYKFKFWLFI